MARGTSLNPDLYNERSVKLHELHKFKITLSGPADDRHNEATTSEIVGWR
jgi:hypothetical protein